MVCVYLLVATRQTCVALGESGERAVSETPNDCHQTVEVVQFQQSLTNKPAQVKGQHRGGINNSLAYQGVICLNCIQG